MSDFGDQLESEVFRLQALVALREAEIERLRSIIGRLPKTADGEPVTPGVKVWTWLGDEPVQEVTMHAWMRGVYVNCYSTREAAEKARDK